MGHPYIDWHGHRGSTTSLLHDMTRKYIAKRFGKYLSGSPGVGRRKNMNISSEFKFNSAFKVLDIRFEGVLDQEVLGL